MIGIRSMEEQTLLHVAGYKLSFKNGIQSYYGPFEPTRRKNGTYIIIPCLENITLIACHRRQTQSIPISHICSCHECLLAAHYMIQYIYIIPLSQCKRCLEYKILYWLGLKKCFRTYISNYTKMYLLSFQTETCYLCFLT